MMLNIGILARKSVPAPIGEITLTNASGTWLCPAGVTSVSAVLIGRGGNGVQSSMANRGGGGGGALTYGNSITVVPGQTYSYSIDVTSTTIFGMTANGGGQGTSTNTGGTGGASDNTSPATASFPGGVGGTASSGNPAIGGGAGKYDANGPVGNGQGTSLLGITPGGGATYGGGGTSVYSGSGGAGGAGAIRIMWGAGRSFPNNAG